MAKERLFKNAREIVKEYKLEGVKDAHGKRRVYLVGRILPSGNVMLVRYGYANGKRQRISTGAVLVPEHDIKDKKHNMEILRLQSVECDAINVDLERKDADFVPLVKDKVKVIDFVEKLSKQALEETGNKHSYYASFHSLAIHLEMCFGRNISFKNVNKEWVLKFLYYLKTDAVNLNYVRTNDTKRRKRLPLSENSQLRIYRNLNTALGKAVRRDLIASNPCTLIERREKPKERKGTRVYLELSEVQRLINTPFPNTTSYADLREAFLFACFTALRYSDLCSLTMSEVKTGDNGIYIEKVQVKTREHLRIYLDEHALSFIPKRFRNPDEPIFHLPKNSNANYNKAFKQWFVDAGIHKHVTWHCARHTTATVMLSNGIPLAVVSKQLGHTKLSTTEIYAKIVDKAQADAAHKLSDLFLNQYSQPYGT